MIRHAQLEDVDRIVQMGARFIAETTYRGKLPVNREAMTGLVTAMVGGKVGIDSVVFVDEQDRALIGMLGLFVYMHPIAGQLTATEVFWWVEPEHRGRGLRLLQSATSWATQARAVTLQMIAPTAAVAQLYERMHFDQVETTYARAL